MTDACMFFFSSRRRHTRFDCDWSSECALPISARARNAEALCAAAARPLTALAAGECVILITGSLTRAWVSPKIGETDGPVGVAALARALSYGFNAIPVVVSVTSPPGPIRAALRAARLAIVTLEQAKPA